MTTASVAELPLVSEPGARELDAVEPLFDREYYSVLYPDAVATGEDPLRHFMRSGWKRGRNPSGAFHTTNYLLAYPDVARSGMNPLLQYALYGRNEGRRAETALLTMDPSLVRHFFDEEYYLNANADVRLGGKDPLAHFLGSGWKERRNPRSDVNIARHLQLFPSLQVEHVHPFFHLIALRMSDDPQAYMGPLEQFPDVRTLIEHNFDAEYYLERYSDIREAGIDPFEHYLATGCHEGRRPSRHFDPDYYRLRNQDVMRGSLSPVVHFVTRGKLEGRLGASMVERERAAIRRSTVGPALQGVEHGVDIASFSLLSRRLEDAVAVCERLVISFSHDVYVENTGGVQIFIEDEARALESRGCAYLNIAPAVPATFLRSDQDGERFPVIATLGGDVVGKVTLADVQRAALDSAAKHPTLKFLVVVHSLLGHDPVLVQSLFEALPSSAELFYWVHDYSGICPSVNLLRNGVRFCSAPKVSSSACAICTHGERRKRSFDAAKSFLEAVEATVAAPSEAARLTWQESGISDLPVKVIPHGALTSQEAPPRVSTRTFRLRVAFCGYPTHHKGWHLVQQLVDIYHQHPTYEFHHFCSEPLTDARMSFHRVAVSAANRLAMVEALRASEIDVVVVPSIWPETFCFVAYEALAAGAVLLTMRGSGNVEALAEQHPDRSLLAENKEGLIQALASGALLATVRRLQALRTTLEFELSGTTAALLSERQGERD